MANNTNNLPFQQVLQNPIVDQLGRPTPYFMRWLLSLQANVGGNSPSTSSTTDNNTFVNNVNNAIFNSYGSDVIDNSQQVEDLYKMVLGVESQALSAIAMSGNALEQLEETTKVIAVQDFSPRLYVGYRAMGI